MFYSLDLPTSAPAWPQNSFHKPHKSAGEIYFPISSKQSPSTDQISTDHNIDAQSWSLLVTGTKVICNALIENAQLLTDMVIM